MQRQSSSKQEKSQPDSPKGEIFAARLREERMRVEPLQGAFAKRVGITQRKQSALETGTNDLRAEYLHEAAKQGVDVFYVITGERTQPDLLGDSAMQMLSLFATLSADMQRIALGQLHVLADGYRGERIEGQQHSSAIHDRAQDYHPESGK